MNDLQSVETVLQTYFDGLYHCDTRLLGSAFHPRAIYATADEVPFLFRTMEEYFPVVAERQSPASRNEPRNDVIERIEFAGNNTAQARVQCSIGDRDFVDFLSLAKVDGAWKIISKVFHIRANEAGGTR